MKNKRNQALFHVFSCWEWGGRFGHKNGRENWACSSLPKPINYHATLDDGSTVETLTPEPPRNDEIVTLFLKLLGHIIEKR